MQAAGDGRGWQSPKFSLSGRARLHSCQRRLQAMAVDGSRPGLPLQEGPGCTLASASSRRWLWMAVALGSRSRKGQAVLLSAQAAGDGCGWQSPKALSLEGPDCTLASAGCRRWPWTAVAQSSLSGRTRLWSCHDRTGRRLWLWVAVALGSHSKKGQAALSSGQSRLQAVAVGGSRPGPPLSDRARLHSCQHRLHVMVVPHLHQPAQVSSM